MNVGDHVAAKNNPRLWLGKVIAVWDTKLEIDTPYGKTVVDEGRVNLFKLPESNRKEVDIMGVKVVLNEKEGGGGVLIGVMKDGCDPFMTSSEGNLIEALETVPGIIGQAQEKWKEEPRNPAYKAPAAKPKPKDKPKAEKPKETPPAEQKTEDLPLLAGAPTIEPTTPGSGETTQAEETPEETSPGKGTEIPEVGTTEQETTEPGGSSAVASPVAEQGAGPVDPETEAETPSEVERKCRVCGCTDLNACEGGCSWVEEDLCSNCQGKEKPMTCEEVNALHGKREPGLYLTDGRGPFANVQAALDALGLPKEKRPNHNRYSRLSKELQNQIVVQE